MVLISPGLLIVPAGMAVIALVLVILIVALSLSIRSIRGSKPQKGADQELYTPVPSVGSYATPQAPDEEELVAVIAAAVAALYGDKENQRYVIRKIRPLQERPVWAHAGLLEGTRPFHS